MSVLRRDAMRTLRWRRVYRFVHNPFPTGNGAAGSVMITPGRFLQGEKSPPSKLARQQAHGSVAVVHENVLAVGVTVGCNGQAVRFPSRSTASIFKAKVLPTISLLMVGN